MSLLQRIMGGPPQAAVRAEPVLKAAPVLRASVPDQSAANAGFHILGAQQSRVKTLPHVSPITAERHATVFACCSVIAGDLAKVPLIVWQKNKDGTEARVKDHPVDYLLNVETSAGVPAQQARFDLAYSFCLRGRAYAFAPRDGAGEVVLIDVLHPDLVGELHRGRSRFYSFTDGDEVARVVPGRSVVHLRYMALDNWTGRSPLIVAAESVGLALAGQEAAARVASGTHMRAFAKFDDFFDDAEAHKRAALQLRAAIEDPNANGIPILEKGELKSLELKAADQELLASRKFDREMIASIYRVPTFKLQITDGVKANGQQQAIDYKTDCLTHWGGLFASFASLTLLTEAERRAGMTLAHDWDALLEPTTAELYNAIKVAVGGPVMTVEEGRTKAGLGPLTKGAVLYPPANMTAPSGALGNGA
jgi:HK97 family phage portal protein